jgi:SWI/SNF-related matrix-associated actin-dependent regulator 1 of chromatin subfamily A
MTAVPQLDWTTPEMKGTERGPRMVSTATPNEAFWQVWRSHKPQLIQAGYTVRKIGAAWLVQRAEPLPEQMQAAQAAAREASRATDAAIETPAPEGLSYLPYQRAGIAFAAQRPATLIADEMGLGKTIQAIGLMNATPEAERILVICPASLRLNWRRECAKWLVKKRPIAVIESGKSTWPHFAEVVIINYDLLGKFHTQLRAKEWDILVADECHALKNGKAKRTAEVVGRKEGRKGREIVEAMDPIPAKRRVFLTGTPIINRPVELWSLISFLDPTNWNHFFHFAKRYCAAHQTSHGWDFSGASHLDELQDRLRESVMVRRLKADVLTDLPPKRRQVIALPANGASALVAKEAAAEARHEATITQARIALELAKAADDASTYEQAVEKLRSATSAAFTEMAQLRHDTALAKVPYVIEHLLDASGKVVVMAHHHDVVNALRAGLEKEHPGSVVVLTGDTSMHDRQAAVDRFQQDPRCLYFIGSIRAAGVGLTLTAASHVVFAELDWTPGAMSQAEDRCHRIGQVNSVLVQHIVLDGSLDCKLAHTLVAKQAVIDRALDTKEATEETPAEAPADFDLDDLLAEAAQQLRDRAELAKLSQEERAAREKAEAEAAAAERAQATKERREEAATKRFTREAIAEAAAKITDEQVAAIHMGLRLLDGANQDRAMQRNNVGFNRVDTGIGMQLAGQATLTKKQAVLGAKVLRKYKRQLPAGIYSAIVEAAA